MCVECILTYLIFGGGKPCLLCGKWPALSTRTHKNNKEEADG